MKATPNTVMNFWNDQIAVIKRTLLLTLMGMMVVLAGCKVAPPTPEGVKSITYESWNQVLAANTGPEGVDYAAIKADPDPLRKSILEIQAVSPADFSRMDRDQQLAFLINAHNIFAVDRIIDHYPVKSMGSTRLIGSARGQNDIILLGEYTSLKKILEEIMSEKYHEARAIFLVNWGAKGCAPLPPYAITNFNLRDLLDRQAKETMADDEYVKYERTKHRIKVTPLLREYRKEFRRQYTTLRVFLTGHLPADVAKNIENRPPRIRFLSFNNKLNDAKIGE